MRFLGEERVFGVTWSTHWVGTMGLVRHTNERSPHMVLFWEASGDASWWEASGDASWWEASGDALCRDPFGCVGVCGMRVGRHVALSASSN